MNMLLPRLLLDGSTGPMPPAILWMLPSPRWSISLAVATVAGVRYSVGLNEGCICVELVGCASVPMQSWIG